MAVESARRRACRMAFMIANSGGRSQTVDASSAFSTTLKSLIQKGIVWYTTARPSSVTSVLRLSTGKPSVLGDLHGGTASGTLIGVRSKICAGVAKQYAWNTAIQYSLLATFSFAGGKGAKPSGAALSE
jgi:hypothetical protein